MWDSIWERRDHALSQSQTLGLARNRSQSSEKQNECSLRTRERSVETMQFSKALRIFQQPGQNAKASVLRLKEEGEACAVPCAGRSARSAPFLHSSTLRQVLLSPFHQETCSSEVLGKWRESHSR